MVRMEMSTVLVSFRLKPVNSEESLFIPLQWNLARPLRLIRPTPTPPLPSLLGVASRPLQGPAATGKDLQLCWHISSASEPQ